MNIFSLSLFQRQFLNAGKHVLVEYPMTLSWAAAQDLWKLAEQKGDVYSVCLEHRPPFKISACKVSLVPSSCLSNLTLCQIMLLVLRASHPLAIPKIVGTHTECVWRASRVQGWVGICTFCWRHISVFYANEKYELALPCARVILFWYCSYDTLLMEKCPSQSN